MAGGPRVVCLEAHPDEQERRAGSPAAQEWGDTVHRGEETGAEGPTPSEAPAPTAP